MRLRLLVPPALCLAAFFASNSAAQLYCRLDGFCFAWPTPIGLTCPEENRSEIPCPPPTPTPTPTPTATPTPAGTSVPVSFDPGLTTPCFSFFGADGRTYPVDVPQAPDCTDHWLVAGSRQWGAPGSDMRDLNLNRDGHGDFFWNRLAAGGIIVTLGLREDGVDPQPYTWAVFGSWQPISFAGGDLWLEVSVYYGDSRYQLPGADRVMIQTGVWGGNSTYDIEIVTGHHRLWFGPWPGSAWVCAEPGAWTGISLDHYCVLFGEGQGYATPFNRTTALRVPITALYRQASTQFPTHFPAPPGGWDTASLGLCGVSIEAHGQNWVFVNVSDMTVWRGYPHARTSVVVRKHLTQHERAPLASRRNQ